MHDSCSFHIAFSVSSSVDRLNISSLPITCVCALSQRSYKPIFCILPLPNVGFVENEKAIRAKAIFLLEPESIPTFCSLSCGNDCNDFYARYHIFRQKTARCSESEYILHFEFLRVWLCGVLLLLCFNYSAWICWREWTCKQMSLLHACEWVGLCGERERDARERQADVSFCHSAKNVIHALYNATVSISLFVLSLADGILQRCAFCFFQSGEMLFELEWYFSISVKHKIMQLFRSEKRKRKEQQSLTSIPFHLFYF
jgi:hypothetical protein